jgi:hypothetical protein
MGAYTDDELPTIIFDAVNRKVTPEGRVVVKTITTESVSRIWNPDEYPDEE